MVTVHHEIVKGGISSHMKKTFIRPFCNNNTAQQRVQLARSVQSKCCARTRNRMLQHRIKSLEETKGDVRITNDDDDLLPSPATQQQQAEQQAEQQQQQLSIFLDSLPSPAPPKRIDPYKAAGQRLERLLSGVGDGEEELLNMMIMQEDVERKVTVAFGAGLGVSTLSCVACWICGLDPAGGATLSLDTLRAAAVGGAVALPLVAMKAALWSQPVRSALPFIEEMHERQITEFQPILYQLNPVQTFLVMGSEVVPSLLILFTACIGGVEKLLDFYFSSGGIESDANPIAGAASLLIAAFILSLTKLADLTPTSEEYAVLKDALDNSDRYYRLISQGRDSLGNSDADADAAAFRAVAITWLAQRQVAARFAAVLSLLEVLYLGGLWRVTGDFAAPLVAGICSAAVDFAAIRETMPSTSTTQGGPPPSGGSPTPF